MITYAKILQNNLPIQLNCRLDSPFWKIEIIAKIINQIFLLLLIMVNFALEF